ncbi:hypothetical protein Pvag_pPag10002 (plasmid) [Pantoea vagans C9-1]|nr:hypothetical protein Pvag_pPag10002 [Pantoea vagans C9-1]
MVSVIKPAGYTCVEHCAYVTAELRINFPLKPQGRPDGGLIYDALK